MASVLDCDDPAYRCPGPTARQHPPARARPDLAPLGPSARRPRDRPPGRCRRTPTQPWCCCWTSGSPATATRARHPAQPLASHTHVRAQHLADRLGFLCSSLVVGSPAGVCGCRGGWCGACQLPSRGLLRRIGYLAHSSGSQRQAAPRDTGGDCRPQPCALNVWAPIDSWPHPSTPARTADGPDRA